MASRSGAPPPTPPVSPRIALREGSRRSPITALGPVDRLQGLGAAARGSLAEHGIRTVADLVWLAPSGFDDLRAPASLKDAIEIAAGEGRGPRAIVHAVVKSAAIVPIRRRRSVRVVVRDADDGSCTMHVFWFFLAQGVLAIAKPGAEVLLVGRITVPPKGPPRMAHPDLYEDSRDARVVRPRYPRVGPSGAAVRKAIASAISEGIAPDPVPPSIAAREKMGEVAAILPLVHGQQGAPPSSEAMRAFAERLAWVEAFTRVWERIGAEAAASGRPSAALPPAERAVSAFVRELGFELTTGQTAAIAAIASDLGETKPMRRLLLGDVGTGKTAVALAAVAQAVASGRQAAILAPTSVLAEQYLVAAAPLVRATGAKIAFVAAGAPAADRKRAEAALARGEALLAIGTHALLGEGITIPKLALVVVDEQQRLGVAQRLALVKKGASEVAPHLLTLTATPIPRTLALALRGELATSTLSERPRGREAPKTVLAPKSNLAAVRARVIEACGRGDRVFWVVPRVAETDDEEDEVAPLASVTERARELSAAIAPHRTVVLHGKMPAADQREAMRAFRGGEAKVLVGTTVVEIGVDVPEATLMVVEDAEQFGLAQLHQLRGRVGRGDRPGTCVLVHGDPLEGLAKERLTALVTLSSGDAIAARDLELRGAGDLAGTRQSGDEPELLYLDPSTPYPWLERIEDDARAVHSMDPELGKDEHQVLRSLALRLSRAIGAREEAG